MNCSHFDALIVLGGGRNNEGDLTELSIQRLDNAYELYKRGAAKKIFAMGGSYSTYSAKAISFQQSGAELRRDYLVKKGADRVDIVMVENGRDTIGEAFASRVKAQERNLKNLLVVTSDKHMPRALWIFRRVYGKDYHIEGRGVPCGDILNEEEEKEYMAAVDNFFSNFPDEIPDPNLETWFDDNKNLYDTYKEIHDKYHPSGGPESQAYMGVR